MRGTAIIELLSSERPGRSLVWLSGVAQGDSNIVDCRIAADDADDAAEAAEAERISDEVNAYTHYLVSGA